MTTRSGTPRYVAYQLPSICRAGFIGGAGGCAGAGGGVGIEGPLLSWNDCELQAAIRHASTKAIVTVVDEHGRSILARGICFSLDGRDQLGARRSIAETFPATSQSKSPLKPGTGCGI